MKKLLFLFVFLLIGSFCVEAQEIKVKSSPVMSYSTEQEAIGQAVATTEYVVIKNVRHIVYKTGRNSYYYIIRNNKGLYVRKYFKHQ